MPSPGDIRAGGASVEIRADTSQLKAGLDQAKAKVAAFSGEMNSGGGRTAPLLIEGLRGYTALHVATAAVKAFTAALREGYTAGDAVDALFTSMPFGVGAYYDAMKDLRAELDGTAGAFRDFLIAADVRSTFVKGVRAIQEFRHTLQTQGRLVGATPLEAIGIQAEQDRRAVLAKAKESGLEPGHAQIVGALKDVESKRAAAEFKQIQDERNKSIKAYVDLLEQAKDAISKVSLSEEDYADWQIKHAENTRNLSKEDQAALLAYRLTAIRKEKDKKAADDAEQLRRQTLTEGGERNLAQLDEETRKLKEREHTLQGVREGVETPAERLRREVGDLQGLREGLGETDYKRAVLSAVMRFSAGLPSVTTQGAFGGLDAAAMRSAGSVDKMAAGIDKVAQNTTALLPLVRELGITFE